MQFGDRMIRQIMFGEVTIDKQEDACEKLVERRQEQSRVRQEMETGQDDNAADQ